MIELPEAIRLSSEMQKEIAGKTVAHVLPPSKEHKFCWFSGDPSAYDAALRGSKAVSVSGFGMYVEIVFDNGLSLAINDGVNPRLCTVNELPQFYQLAIEFEDFSALVFTVAMYGGIVLHGNDYDNEYYVKSRNTISPLAKEFPDYYWKLIGESKPKLSAKAFIATEQRFPGIGNGCAQDILLNAGLNPKRKLETMSQADREKLLSAIVSVIGEMVRLDGRDTEKGLDGSSGGYRTLMCKNSLIGGCPVCGGTVTKEAYLGGSVYYCPECQPLVK